MSNTQRPSTARKVTGSSERKREEALDNGLRISLDGESYEVRLGDVNSHVAKEFRNATGMGPLQFLNAAAFDMDVDYLAAFIFLARRIRGEQVRLEDVTVTYAQMLSDGFNVDMPTEEPDPEA